MKKVYIPNLNEEILIDYDCVYLPDYTFIKLMETIYPLDKKYKIEKIVSFSKKDYYDDLKNLFSREIEIYNHYIEGETSYFHITFEKVLDDKLGLNYDRFCKYAISIVINNDDNEYRKYQNAFLENKKS